VAFGWGSVPRVYNRVLVEAATYSRWRDADSTSAATKKDFSELAIESPVKAQLEALSRR
jgi:hypothetical protein